MKAKRKKRMRTMRAVVNEDGRPRLGWISKHRWTTITPGRIARVEIREVAR